MGRKNKYYFENLHNRAYDIMVEKFENGKGVSKKLSKIQHETDDKIFSASTLNNYRQHLGYFFKYVYEKHPDCTTIKSARKYVREWIQYRIDTGKNDGTSFSSWSLLLDRQSVNKLYNIKPGDDDFVKIPKRNRQDIVRSRGPAKRDKHFSEKNNAELLAFCDGTGCRRAIMRKLEGRDLWTREKMEEEVNRLKKKGVLSVEEKGSFVCLEDALTVFPEHDFFIHHRRDKGGRERFSPIIGEKKNEIVNRFRRTGTEEKVWKRVHSAADIHARRAIYATNIYNMYARPISEIPYDGCNKGTGRRYQTEVYICRKDEAGKKLDKKAMFKASKALGHNRIEIVANNYIRDLETGCDET